MKKSEKKSFLVNCFHKYVLLLGLLYQPKCSYYKFFFLNFNVIFKKETEMGYGLFDYLKGVGVRGAKPP